MDWGRVGSERSGVSEQCGDTPPARACTCRYVSPCVSMLMEGGREGRTTPHTSQPSHPLTHPTPTSQRNDEIVVRRRRAPKPHAPPAPDDAAFFAQFKALLLEGPYTHFRGYTFGLAGGRRPPMYRPACVHANERMDHTPPPPHPLHIHTPPHRGPRGRGLHGGARAGAAACAPCRLDSPVRLYICVYWVWESPQSPAAAPPHLTDPTTNKQTPTPKQKKQVGLLQGLVPQGGHARVGGGGCHGTC